MRIMTFFVLSELLAVNFASLASIALRASVVAASRLTSMTCSNQDWITKLHRASSPSLALRMSTPFTPANCFSLYSKSLLSASSISRSNFFLSSLSPRLASVRPNQVPKEVWTRDLSLPSAKPRRAFLDFSFCSAPNFCNCDSTAMSCCCACSASSADLVRRSSRFSMLRNHVSWHLCKAATSLLAWTTACFRICWPMDVESTSSTVSWMPSGTPSSIDFRTREVVVTSIWSCRARWSKSSRMTWGSLGTSSTTICCSSISANSLISSGVRGTPLSAMMSSAAVTAFVCVHPLPRTFMTR
mmetsp:Transcript_1367/g.3730  ORF Transcript_1367/g.3730 Transcript_1367/m.3730 type:complete len:300 (+) Transcript_1367:827-1726(+)